MYFKISVFFRKELSSSLLNLVVAGTSEGLATMLEGDAKESSMPE